MKGSTLLWKNNRIKAFVFSCWSGTDIVQPATQKKVAFPLEVGWGHAATAEALWLIARKSDIHFEDWELITNHRTWYIDHTVNHIPYSCQGDSVQMFSAPWVGSTADSATEDLYWLECRLWWVLFKIPLAPRKPLYLLITVHQVATALHIWTKKVSNANT